MSIKQDFQKFMMRKRNSPTQQELLQYLKSLFTKSYSYTQIYTHIKTTISQQLRASITLFKSVSMIRDLIKSISNPIYVPLVIPFCDFDLKELRHVVRESLSDPKVFEFDKEIEKLRNYEQGKRLKDLEVDIAYRVWDFFYYVQDLMAGERDPNLELKWLALVTGGTTNDMILIGGLIPDILKRQDKLNPNHAFLLLKSNLPGSGNLAICFNQMRSTDTWIKSFSMNLSKNTSPSTILKSTFRDCYPPEALNFFAKVLGDCPPSTCEDVMINFCAPCLFKNLASSIYYQNMAMLIRYALQNCTRLTIAEKDLQGLIRAGLNQTNQGDHRSLIQQIRAKCGNRDFSKITASTLGSTVKKQQSKINPNQNPSYSPSHVYQSQPPSTQTTTTSSTGPSYHRQPSNREQIIFECQDYIGLPNIGNTCYINSFLINLYFSEEFKRFFSKEDFGDPTLLALRKIFICLDRKDRLPLEKLTKEFKESLPEDFSDNNMQHDAMEFGRVMIDKLMMTKGLEKQVKELFETRFQELILCPRGDTSSKRPVVQSIIIISFEDPKSVILKSEMKKLKIGDMVQSYFQTTNIASSFTCEKCHQKYSSCDRQMTSIQVPEIMIVALSRFTYSKEKQKYRKIIDKVEIGDYLILDNVSTKNRNVKYKLNSFINHMGSSLESGHYQAYVRHPKEERWLNFDDAYVTEQDCQKSETLFNSFNEYDSPYLLFYKLI